MDRFRALQVFSAIVEAGSLTSAAERLDMSLPTVTRHLAALEAELGARLLQRTTRSMLLTPEGSVYLERARQVLGDMKAADDELRERHPVPRGSLLVSAPVLLGQMHVAPAVTRFLQKFSEIRVKLTLEDRVVNLVDEGVDVAVRVGALPDSSMVAQSLGQVRHVVVASPAYLRKSGVPRDPRELSSTNAKANCIRFSGPHASGWTFRVNEQRINVPVAGSLECNLVGPALDACVAGLGFARVQSYQATPYLQEKRLRVVLAEFEEEPHEVSLVYAGGRLQPARVKAFIDWMKKDFPKLA